MNVRCEITDKMTVHVENNFWYFHDLVEFLSMQIRSTHKGNMVKNGLDIERAENVKLLKGVSFSTIIFPHLTNNF